VCVCMHLFCVYVVLCLGSGLATGWSLVQGVLPPVKNDYGSEEEAWVLNGLEEPSKKKKSCYVTSRHSSADELYSALQSLLQPLFGLTSLRKKHEPFYVPSLCRPLKAKSDASPLLMAALPICKLFKFLNGYVLCAVTFNAEAYTKHRTRGLFVSQLSPFNGFKTEW
jgi:hypothetical protein